MKNLLLKTLLAPALLLAVACEDMPTAPISEDVDDALVVPGPSFQLETSDGQTALRWEDPLKEDEEESRGISEEGGKVEVDPGIELIIPKGALNEKTNITILSRAGEDVAFEFGPHGLEFDRPVTVRIELDELENQHELLSAAKMAYYSNGGGDANRIQLGSITAIYYANQNGELVQVLQTFPVYLVDGKYLEFETDHFSGYALAA